MATTVAGGTAAAPGLTTTGHEFGSKGYMRTINLNDASIKPLSNQVGGHKSEDKGKPPYILRFGEDRVLKIVADNAKGERELAFYQTVFPHEDASVRVAETGWHGQGIPCRQQQNEEEKEEEEKDCVCTCEKKVLALQPFVSAFHGVGLVNDVPYMILDDLTKPYASCLDDGSHDCGPSLMDIKIGRKTTGPWASADKVHKESTKNPYQEQMGFRICGMKLYDPLQKTFIDFTSEDGKKVTPDTVAGALRRFFVRPRLVTYTDRHTHTPADSSSKVNLVRSEEEGGEGEETRLALAIAMERLDFFLRRLKRLEAWFEAQRVMRFFASSLLFIDANHHIHNPEKAEEKGKEEEEEEEERSPFADIRMIDFAHVEFRPPQQAKEGEKEKGEGGDGNGGCHHVETVEELEGWDDNYTYGLRMLCSILEGLREEMNGKRESRS